jgi:hypothetical protein
MTDNTTATTAISPDTAAVRACAAGRWASQGTTYIGGIQQWNCGHFAGSPPCTCVGNFYTAPWCGEPFAYHEEVAALAPPGWWED